MSTDANKIEAKEPEVWSTFRLWRTGFLLNFISGGLLFCFAYFLDLAIYVYIAVGLQFAVFFLNGLPFNSEKLYDLSGSATHFAVVAASLCS